MSNIEKIIIILSLGLMTLAGYSYNRYLTHKENLAKINAEIENRHIIAKLKSE